MKLGFLGAYSIANAGDALVGYATRRSILARLGDVDYQVLAPALPHAFWDHAWDAERGLGDPIRAIPATTDCTWANDFDAVIIGGGGLLMLDPMFAPFHLGDPAQWPARCKAAWNGVGSQNQPWYLRAHAADYARIAAACERLAYASVRSQTSARFVRACGFTGEIHVIPDPAIALASIPPAVGIAVDDLLARLGLAPSRGRARPLLGLSLGAATNAANAAPFFAALERELAALSADCDLVFFPFSRLQDDIAAQTALGQRLGARVVTDVLSPLALWALIGRLDAYVASRFHGVIAAYTQDVPFVAIDEYLRDAIASSKIREMIVDRELEVHYVCPFLPDASAWKIPELVRQRERVTFRERIAEDRRRLDEHYRTMLRRLDVVSDVG